MSKLFKDYPTVTHEFEEVVNGKRIVRKVELKDITVKYDINPVLKSGGNDGSNERTYRFLTKDNMRPESLANIYYNDPYNFWMILKANDIYEHYTESSIATDLMDDYLYRKYRKDAIESIKPGSTETYKDTVSEVIAYTKDEISHYVNSDGFIVDKFQTGAVGISIYELEHQENEKRRNIRVINDELASDIEKELSDKLNELRR